MAFRVRLRTLYRIALGHQGSLELVLDQIPSGLPQPDGAQRIKNASHALSIARKEMATAHNRLNDYLSRGIVPDDLKQGSGD